MNLETRDWSVIVGGILLSLSGGYLSHSGAIAAEPVTAMLPKITMLVLGIGAILAFLSRDLVGGTTARSLTVVASGFFIYAVLYYPHKVMWHGADEPAWIGVNPGAWQTFFHLFTVITLVIVSYGFYLFWQMGRGGTQ